MEEDAQVLGDLMDDVVIRIDQGQDQGVLVRKIEGGHLFSIHLLTEFEDYTVYPDYDVLGSLEVYKIGSYNIIVTYPTDVQFSNETVEKYNEMTASIPDVLDTISFKDECIFAKTPIPIIAE